MDSYEYQLTIKSANQKVDDYVTKCCSNWNVKRLKQHISETHVNKPSIEDQRLIYAGNLLKDHQILKQIFFRDSLCTELTNSSKTDFTIHLVCSQPKIVSNNNTNRASSTSIAPTPNSNNNNVGASNINNSRIGLSVASTTTTPSVAAATTANQTSSLSQTNSNGVPVINRPTTSINIQIPVATQDRLTFGTSTHQSGTGSNITTTTTTTIRLNNQNQTTSITRSTPITLINNQLTTALSNGQSAQQAEMIQNLMQSDHMRQQMAVFQHLAYMVASQIAQNINRVPSTDRTTTSTTTTPAPVVEQPQANQRNDQEAPAVQHDVIDWVYYSIRAFVLMAALYIHASMFRLFFIVGILLTAYFFHRGSFRRRGRQQQAQAQDGAQQQQGINNLELGNEQQENGGEIRRRNLNPEDQPFNGEQNNNDNELGERPQDNRGPGNNGGRLPILKLCYLVLTDFLASLVPE